MYKTTLTMIAALLLASGVARAQAPSYDVAADCDAGKVEKLKRAVDDAFRRLADVDNVVNSAPEHFDAAFAKAFGQYEPDTDESQWAGVFFLLYHANIRPLLSNTSGFTISSDPPPTWPRVSFRCAALDFADLVAERVDSQIVLYPVFFDDQVVPNAGRWGRVRASRVGTILHEAVHLLGGPMDIREDGREQDVQAEQLAADRDGRALSNASNYEMFYMSYPFQGF